MGIEGADPRPEITAERPLIVASDRDWWPVWLMGSAAALLLAIAMIFTVVTSVQARIHAEERDDEFRARVECRAAFSAAITASEQRADNGDHALLAEIVRQIVEPGPGDSGLRLVEIADATSRENAHTSDLIQQLEDYIAAGSPLPCPMEVG